MVIVQLEGLGKLKKSTSSGLEPTTFQLVAQCLNKLNYRVLEKYYCCYSIYVIEADINAGMDKRQQIPVHGGNALYV
jgi:hypothetical protein